MVCDMLRGASKLKDIVPNMKCCSALCHIYLDATDTRVRASCVCVCVCVCVGVCEGLKQQQQAIKM